MQSLTDSFLVSLTDVRYNEFETEGMKIPYEIYRSSRKTLAIEIRRDGQVAVRAPAKMSETVIHEFILKNRQWIAVNYCKKKERITHQKTWSEQEVLFYREKAGRLFGKKTEYWAEKMGVQYGRITIREQLTRWGSCSRKGNLNFNWKLVLLPEEIADYIVVHELAHRTEMNHSTDFWKIVERELPDYRDIRRRLREYESEIC